MANLLPLNAKKNIITSCFKGGSALPLETYHWKIHFSKERKLKITALKQHLNALPKMLYQRDFLQLHIQEDDCLV